MARGTDLIKDPKARKVLTKWLAGESRYIVTVEVAMRDVREGDDAIHLLDVAIEEGMIFSPLFDQGITYIGMSKPQLLDLKDWTV